MPTCYYSPNSSKVAPGQQGAYFGYIPLVTRSYIAADYNRIIKDF